MQPPYTQKHLLEIYPVSSAVKFGDLTTTLDQAIKMESLCPQPVEVRSDEIGRIQWMARALMSAGTLRTEDYNLLNLNPKPIN